MPAQKSNFLDKVLGRIGRLDAEGLQTVVQRLARERSFLETLFNTIEDGILVVDENGKVIYLNQAVQGLLGLQPGVVEGESLKTLLPEANWEQLSKLDTGGGNKVVRQEFEISFPRPRFLRMYAAPLDGEARGSSGVALIFHDATEARQQTFEAIESERIQALTLLAASVAHELGNPLNALHIHLQLIERELKKWRELSPPLKKKRERRTADSSELSGEQMAAERLSKLDHYVKVAKGEIVRLDYIVTQFLQAIRPTPPRLVLTSLNAVMQETLELLAPELENRGILVEQRLARQLPDAKLDPVQMKQVLVNVIKNAMQAMTHGGKLTLQTGSTPDYVWAQVEDTGTGIPSEQLNLIFKPFFTTKKKGSGLGLMIVQRIVRDHGGRIDLQSRSGQGTTFRIWLPLHERSPRLLQAASQPGGRESQ